MVTNTRKEMVLLIKRIIGFVLAFVLVAGFGGYFAPSASAASNMKVSDELVKILKIVSDAMTIVTSEKMAITPRTPFDITKKRDVCFDVIRRRKK